MNIYFTLAFLIIISSGFAYLNQRFLKLPFVIGLFFISTVISILIISSRLWLHLPIDDISKYIERLLSLIHI